jgi:subtilisin family serine protease
MAGDTHIIVGARLAAEADAVVYAQELEQRYGLQLMAVWPLASVGITCLVLQTAEDAEAIAAALLGETGVAYSYPMQVFATSEDVNRKDLSGLQDNLVEMQVSAAHELSQGDGITVALVDTGLAKSHDDLASQDITLRDFVRPDGVAPETERHGTAMAAIIAAENETSTGIAGIAPHARLLALRACWETGAARKGNCNTFSLARALNFAVLNKADIINLSVTGPSDPILAEVMVTAIKAGIPIIAAEPPQGPANLTDPVPGVIVAGLSKNAKGTIVAPGVDVISAEPVNSYDFFSGSSVSAAHVTGAAALLRSLVPSANPADLKSALLQGSRGGQTALDICEAVHVISEGKTACPRTGGSR